MNQIIRSPIPLLIIGMILLGMISLVSVTLIGLTDRRQEDVFRWNLAKGEKNETKIYDVRPGARIYWKVVNFDNFSYRFHFSNDSRYDSRDYSYRYYWTNYTDSLLERSFRGGSWREKEFSLEISNIYLESTLNVRVVVNYISYLEIRNWIPFLLLSPVGIFVLFSYSFYSDRKKNS
ncbi:MAG: hypothetical protein HeimC3_15710 [Candidatus Heimdallarchaeota archaeon LC_3]|nr:MAG: hypothetical protein HeimC3_15710 [Candidatus Heimdallarchaeota archaeon LC_3]